jgi:hypothetical protein
LSFLLPKLAQLCIFNTDSTIPKYVNQTKYTTSLGHCIGHWFEKIPSQPRNKINAITAYCKLCSKPNRHCSKNSSLFLEFNLLDLTQKNDKKEFAQNRNLNNQFQRLANDINDNNRQTAEAPQLQFQKRGIGGGE